MGSDRPVQPEERRRGQRPWVARVGKGLSASTVAAPEPNVQGLAELAEKASDAASASARHAEGAAKAASLAGLTVDRLGSAPIDEARRTVLEISGSANRAGSSSVEARDRAALVDHAAQSEAGRGPEQPVRPAGKEITEPEDPGNHREER